MNENTTVESFDMNQCKPGDKLLLRSGRIATYIERSTCSSDKTYPHVIMCRIPDHFGTRTDDGRVFLSR